MKRPSSRTAFRLVAWLLLITSFVSAQDENFVPASVKENAPCLKCHGHKYLSYYNDFLGRDVKERMNPYYIIDSSDYFRSNHRNLECIDCHSYDYKNTFPHPNELRFEPMLICMDCHEGDDIYNKYHFATINDEYLKSVHSEKHSEEFNCWMCHDPHSYRITARTDSNLLETIQYDNEICLSCHGNQSKMGLLSDRKIYDMLNQHEWLPNNRLHFQNVRCIECHARLNDTLLVPHQIQPKEKAVKLCVECHSKNTILMATLYKHMSEEARKKEGFLNAAILKRSYVIGANRNYFLNYGSMVIFALVIVGLITHAVLRKINSKDD